MDDGTTVVGMIPYLPTQRASGLDGHFLTYVPFAAGSGYIWGSYMYFYDILSMNLKSYVVTPGEKRKII